MQISMWLVSRYLLTFYKSPFYSLFCMFLSPLRNTMWLFILWCSWPIPIVPMPGSLAMSPSDAPRNPRPPLRFNLLHVRLLLRNSSVEKSMEKEWGNQVWFVAQNVPPTKTNWMSLSVLLGPCVVQPSLWIKLSQIFETPWRLCAFCLICPDPFN